MFAERVRENSLSAVSAETSQFISDDAAFSGVLLCANATACCCGGVSVDTLFAHEHKHNAVDNIIGNLFICSAKVVISCTVTDMAYEKVVNENCLLVNFAP